MLQSTATLQKNVEAMVYDIFEDITDGLIMVKRNNITKLHNHNLVLYVSILKNQKTVRHVLIFHNHKPVHHVTIHTIRNNHIHNKSKGS